MIFKITGLENPGFQCIILYYIMTTYTVNKSASVVIKSFFIIKDNKSCI